MIMNTMIHVRLRRLLSIIAIGVIIMNAFTLLTGCSVFEADTAKTVKKMLNERYGLDFEVTNMGNRINTGSVTLYCYPKNDEDIRFTAVYDYSSKELVDDYIPRVYARAVDNEISSLCSGVGIAVSSITTFIGANSNELIECEDINDFISKSNATKLYILMAVNADDLSTEENAQHMLSSLETLSMGYGNIDILAGLFMYHSDIYNRCSDELKKATKANDDWFKAYSPISDFTVKIVDGKAQKTASELLISAKG